LAFQQPIAAAVARATTAHRVFTALQLYSDTQQQQYIYRHEQRTTCISHSEYNVRIYSTSYSRKYSCYLARWTSDILHHIVITQMPRNWC